MPCEHYKGALIEAAATGAAPEGELRAHIAECAACRELYAQEESLFAAIDSNLHAVANAEVPVSLLPRVRASLDEVGAPRRRWVQPLIYASTGVALALLIFLMARPHRATPENIAKRGPVAAPAPVESATNTNPVRPSEDVQAEFGANRHSHPERNSTVSHSAASSNPEVLVPPNEREAFTRFVATLNERNGVAAALLAHAPERDNALVSVDPLQIPEIEIKPLEGTEAETSDGASENR